MTVEINIESNIQIPQSLYNEAAELFLNHLEKYYEAQLLKDGGASLTFPNIVLTKNTRLLFVRPQLRLGQNFPLRYKKSKATCNDQQ